jgi:hypothetical protein
MAAVISVVKEIKRHRDSLPPKGGSHTTRETNCERRVTSGFSRKKARILFISAP